MIEEELLFYFGTTALNEVPRYELIKFPPFSDVSNLRFAAFNKYVRSINYTVMIKICKK